MPAPSAMEAADSHKEPVNFDNLLLVEKPDSPLNSTTLPQTLEDCQGFLQRLPLRSPNADSKRPITIANMVNILTNPEADAMFAEEIINSDARERNEGEPNTVYHDSGTLMEEELAKAKSRSGHRKAPGVFGHVVWPGHISFYTKNGRTFAVAEGRWWLMKNPIRARWLKGYRNVSLDKDKITAEEVHIIRVLPGEVGMIRAQGSEVLLDVGTHVFNSGTVTIVDKVSYSEQKYFHHGRYHYLRVERGYFAKVWTVVSVNGVETVVPRLVGEGVHCIDSHLFKFDAFVKCSERVIEHGTIHRITVVKGNLAKCIQDSKNLILGQGTHLIESTDFEFLGFEDFMSTNFMQHGTTTILRVKKGKIALCWTNGDPLFISEPGIYEFDSPDFSFDSFRDAADQLIQLGSKKVVQVHSGQVAVTYDDGMMKVLSNGRHEINSPTWIFQRFLSTQEKNIQLASPSSNDQPTIKQSKHEESLLGNDNTLLICETKDLIKVGIQASVAYSIVDAKKCILAIDTDGLEDLVRQTATATLTSIIRSTVLNPIAQAKNMSAGIVLQHIEDRIPDSPTAITEASTQVKSIEETPPPSSALVVEFFDKIHDDFVIKLQNDFQDRYGVDISKIKSSKAASTKARLTEEAHPQSALVVEFFDKIHDDFMSKLQDDFRLRYGVDISNITSSNQKPTFVSTEETPTQSAQAVEFFDKIHDDFMSKLQHDFQLRYGVDISNIRIEAFKIMDALIDEQFAKYALTTAQIENEVANLEGMSMIAMQKEKSDAEVKNISAHADAEALKTAAYAENQRIIDKATAEAKALTIMAEADAESIKLKAEAAAARAKMIAKTDLGKQEALLAIYSDMIVNSNKGVQKVVYVDSGINRASPFVLSSMHNLIHDLHLLTKLGIDKTSQAKPSRSDDWRGVVFKNRSYSE